MRDSFVHPQDQIEGAAHVVIVGGGISGLSAAYYLQRAARAAGVDLRYTLVERDSRFGGKLLTDKVGGFVVEGGPDSLLAQKPWGVQLARDLGLADQLIGTNEHTRKVYFLAGGRPQPMPEGMSLIVPTKLGPFLRSRLLSPWGKLRMLLDLAIPARRDAADETLADFIRRRFGAEALVKLAEPLLAGIHNSESERQSLLATFPRLRELELQHGSLIRGMRAQLRNGGARRQVDSRASNPGVTSAPPRPHISSSPFLTLKGGVGALADALVGALEGRLIGGCGVASIEHDPDAPQPYRLRLTSGELLAADAVILSAPAFAAADLVASFQPELADGLRKIRYVTTATVVLAYRGEEFGEPLDGYGLVIPSSERRKINAVTIMSSKFAQRAPAEAALLRVFVGGSRNPAVAELGDAELLTLVRSELSQILGVRAEPLWSRIYRWPRSNPQYDVGHLDHVTELERLCPPGLLLCGSAYRGVGIPDCVRQGQAAAERVLAQIMQTIGEEVAVGV